MDTLRKYKVSIFGESYTLVSDEAEEYLVLSAQHVDELMRQLAEKTGLSDAKRIAVLASLQIACRLKNMEKMLEQSTRRELEFIDQIDRALSSFPL